MEMEQMELSFLDRIMHMPSRNVAAVTADGALYCLDCAGELYGDREIDNEGSPIYHVPGWEIRNGDGCGRCGEDKL